VDEGAACAAVAIGERMDGLELGVCDRRLSQWGVVVAVDVVEEIVEETVDVLGRGRDIACATGVVLAASDPVLLPSAGTTFVIPSPRSVNLRRSATVIAALGSISQSITPPRRSAG